jgi:ribose transport system ATP-binding protein
MSTTSTSTTPTPVTDRPLLAVRGLRKSFGPSQVLKGVDLEVRAGEVHALLGPNGAGKSTLIKILAGIHPADGGSVEVRRVDGTPGRLGVIHQDLGLVDALTVRENLALGRKGVRRAGVLIDHGRERARARRELAAVSLDVDPDTTLSELSLGEKSLVAVARMLAEDADVIVLDETTAALTQGESAWLLTRMQEIAGRGAAVVLVSHRLHEVVEHCAATTLLRDGEVAHSGPTPDIDALHGLFVGGAGWARDTVPAPSQGPVRLALRGVEADGVGPLDLEVRAGEVLGLVGPLSSRLYRVGHVLAGHLAVDAGERRVTPREGGRRERTAFLPEDRKLQGILPLLEVGTNMTISSLPSVSRASWLSRGGERGAIERAMKLLDVQPPDSSLRIDALSGGNQQKALLGRAMLCDPDVYVLCEPTRGVDVGTRHAIYRFIADRRAAGAAVVVITIDPDDAFAVCDSIALVRDGRVAPPRSCSQITTVDLLGEM